VIGDVIVGGTPPCVVAEIYSLRQRDPDHDEKANACLIAAAPDLLAALEALVGDNAATSLCVHKSKDAFGRVMGTWSAEAHEMAINAITKANGGGR
jgi:hypothetical protein